MGGRVASLALARAPQCREVAKEGGLAVVRLVGAGDHVVYVALVHSGVERLFALDERLSREEVHPADVGKRFRFRQEKDGKFGVALVSLPEETGDHCRLDETRKIRRFAVVIISYRRRHHRKDRFAGRDRRRSRCGGEGSREFTAGFDG